MELREGRKRNDNLLSEVTQRERERYREEEEEEDQREMARTKGTKRMESSAATNKSHLETRYEILWRTDRSTT